MLFMRPKHLSNPAEKPCVRNGPRYVTTVTKVKGLSKLERQELALVQRQYAFRTNEYYLSLIDWDDPADPIRRLILPDPSELQQWGNLDPSNEASHMKLEGLEHKYPSTALLLVSNVCGGICRHCFRKRLFLRPGKDLVRNTEAAMDYINEHEEIDNVLITGGDPLALNTGKLERIINRIRQIDHVRIIRLGSKMPAFNPYRILEDQTLLDLAKDCCDGGKQIYLMTHFDHANELTDLAVKALKAMHQAGVVMANQTPIIRGVNDTPHVLARLCERLSAVGVPPYYVFQCRPASGNKGYAVPVEEGYEIFEQAKTLGSGLSKRARFTMSHHSGKIEIIGMTDKHIYFKYHRAAEAHNSGRFMIFKRNPEAYWFDDYDELVGSYQLDLPRELHVPAK